MLLVKKEAGFLTVFHIDNIFYAVFFDQDLGVKRLADKTLEAGHAFQITHFCIAALINAADGYAVFF